MPALHPVPGVIKVHMGLSVGIDVTTGWHAYFSYGAQPPTQGQANSVAQNAASAYQTSLASLHTADRVLTQVLATDLSSATAAVGTYTAVIPGTRTGGQLPANVCVLQNMKVNRRYRGGKPRVYVPGGADTDLLNPQEWTTAFLSAWATGWNSWFGAVYSAINLWGTGASLVNVSYYSGHTWLPDQNGNYHRVPTPRPTPVVDAITQQATSQLLGSQRRRVRSR